MNLEIHLFLLFCFMCTSIFTGIIFCSFSVCSRLKLAAVLSYCVIVQLRRGDGDVVCSQQQIYVASVNNIWRLMCTPVTTQIKQLLACKEFELALHLAVCIPSCFSQYCWCAPTSRIYRECAILSSLFFIVFYRNWQFIDKFTLFCIMRW